MRYKDVVAWVPHYRFRVGQALEQELLHKLKQAGNLQQSPSREIPMGPNINSYGEICSFIIGGHPFMTSKNPLDGKGASVSSLGDVNLLLRKSWQ